jgi:L-aspartate oxidase
VVFGARIADDLRGRAGAAAPPAQPARETVVAPEAGLVTDLRALMAEKAGVIRDGAGLADGLRGVLAIERATGSLELRNMTAAALMILAGAWTRRESRGGHFRADFAAADPAQAQRSRATLAQARRIAENL